MARAGAGGRIAVADNGANESGVASRCCRDFAPPSMLAPMPSTKSEQDSIKWWVDQQRPGRDGRKDGPPAPAAARFYITAKGYEQESARAGLVNLNAKLLEAANPPEGGFGYLSLIDERSPGHIVERVKRALPLPPGARAAIVDSGRSLRAIITGTPPGERILEFNFNREEPTFDVWIRSDWKEEIVFRNLGEIYRAARVLIEEYMGAEALAKPEFWT